MHTLTTLDWFKLFLAKANMVKVEHNQLAADQKSYSSFEDIDGSTIYNFFDHYMMFDHNGELFSRGTTGRTQITLQEGNIEVPLEKRRKVKVRIEGDRFNLCIKPEGYGEPEAAIGHGCPVFLELYDGNLRLIISKDIVDPFVERDIISLEGANENRLENKP